MKMPEKDWWWRKHTKRLWAAITYRYNVHPPLIGASVQVQFKPTVCFDVQIKLWRNSLFASIGTRFKTPKEVPAPIPANKPDPKGITPVAPEE